MAPVAEPPKAEQNSGETGEGDVGGLGNESEVVEINVVLAAASGIKVEETNLGNPVG